MESSITVGKEIITLHLKKISAVNVTRFDKDETNLDLFLNKDEFLALHKTLDVNICEDCKGDSELLARLSKLEREVKDQRNDYHYHIKQLVVENELAHTGLSDQDGRLQLAISIHAKELEDLGDGYDLLEGGLKSQGDTLNQLNESVRELWKDTYKMECPHASKCSRLPTPNCWNTTCRFHDAQKGK